ncbi:hypothetical protein PCL_03075 [Purpureocillium lilacinum]|uniref:Uncharacterized protein n=1 Tax=Purpureocillium lilacinum TaxID=33203 RepID=A0A2U3DYI8_PURLI|nr:hypothetical protein Purlil1_514 [Purpureocillium lilacinum]PWI67307.1 hypothetical protein PCL_03075 [Purpureocillium lilacinum]
MHVWDGESGRSSCTLSLARAHTYLPRSVVGSARRIQGKSHFLHRNGKERRKNAYPWLGPAATSPGHLHFSLLCHRPQDTRAQRNLDNQDSLRLAMNRGPSHIPGGPRESPPVAALFVCASYGQVAASSQTVSMRSSFLSPFVRPELSDTSSLAFLSANPANARLRFPEASYATPNTAASVLAHVMSLSSPLAGTRSHSTSHDEGKKAKELTFILRSFVAQSRYLRPLVPFAPQLERLGNGSSSGCSAPIPRYEGPCSLVAGMADRGIASRRRDGDGPGG